MTAVKCAPSMYDRTEIKKMKQNRIGEVCTCVGFGWLSLFILRGEKYFVFSGSGHFLS